MQQDGRGRIEEGQFGERDREKKRVFCVYLGKSGYIGHISRARNIPLHDVSQHLCVWASESA